MQPDIAKIYYRYLSEEFGLQALQECKLKLGKLLELNDPLDCNPVFLERRPDGTELVVESDPSITAVLDSWGMLSYSLRLTDPVIWSHYANGHRGIALGFAFDARGLYEVSYPDDESRPRIDVQKLRAAQSLRPLESEAEVREIIAEAFTTKAKSWAYEREYRHFVHFDHATMLGKHYFYELRLARLTEVVLGVRCPFSEREVSRVVARHMQPIPRVFRMRKSENKYRLSS